MALSDPVAVYNAANNLQAVFVRDALIAAGIEAFVIEDISQVGTWVGGLIPELHKPRVWVERCDIERAKPVLDEYERRTNELRGVGREGGTTKLVIEVICEDCSRPTSFPATQEGSVQQCPHCGAYVDVGEGDVPEGWEDSEDPEQ
jgi:Putative prokaryotic signal transducing protein